MGECLLSVKEARRLRLLEMARGGQCTIARVVEALGLSRRQVQRQKRRLAEEGPRGLAHRSRGRPASNALAREVREKVVELSQSEAYRGANCTHLSELLAEFEGIKVSSKTLVRVFRAAGIPLARRRRSPQGRLRRERRSRTGDLVLLDGSHHTWFEDRGPAVCCLGAIDDADGRIVSLWFSDVEDTEGYLELMRGMMARRGLPVSVYVDGHSVFTPTNLGKLTVEEELSGDTQGRTQMGRILQSLGVKVIVARSPQAKGRIERLWGTLQDRLVIELRLAGVSNADEANALVPKIMARFNQRFSVQPREETSSYRPAPAKAQWEELLALRESRVVGGDSVVNFGGRCYQLADRAGKPQVVRRGTRVQVAWSSRGGDPWVTMDGKRYDLIPWQRDVRKFAPAASPEPRRPTPPREDHPWRQFGWLSPRHRPPVSPATPAQAAPGRPGGAVRPAATR